jgi:hypothetical protein
MDKTILVTIPKELWESLQLLKASKGFKTLASFQRVILTEYAKSGLGE